MKNVIKNYLKNDDWKVNENSNTNHSFAGLLMRAAGKSIEEYVLDEVYTPDIAYMHRKGLFHIHDLSMGIVGYCAGWSLKNLLLEGFGGVEGKVESAPAKHLSTALGQMNNFLGTLQNEWAGAQAFSSVDTYLSPFIRYDNLNYEQVKQEIQKFVFNLNVASRWGGQTPFTNITFDWNVPEDMKEEYIIHGGELKKEKYKDFQPEMDIVNKAFLEVMSEGDAKNRIFTFPIPTYNITKDFDWNSENANLLFKITAKYGYPYFQNFINSNIDPSDVRSMCCRLQLDLKELRNKTGGIFGAGEQTGSLGVVTINLPRIGYESQGNKNTFFSFLDNRMRLAKESLEIKRKIVSDNIKNGLLPYTKQYLGTIDYHFSTIGLIGMEEAIQNGFGYSIGTDEGKNFALEVLNYMKRKLKEFQEETGNIYNLEATPAEGASYRLAKKDKKQFGNKIYTQGTEVPYYTNSTLLPVNYTNDLVFELNHQNELQSTYTGGTVFHIFLGEMVSNPEAVKKLIKKCAENYRVPYFSLTPTFSICPNCGYLPGEQYTCSTCGETTEVYSRVVGYFRPIKYWNKGKKEEYKDRKTYNI